MDDVKDKVKGFMKKVNNPFSSSSSSSSSSSFSSAKFKGQGRVLGSSPSSTGPSNSNSNSNPTTPPVRSNNNNNKPLPPQTTAPDSSSDCPRQVQVQVQVQPNSPPTTHSNPAHHAFHPFDSFITSGKRTTTGHSLHVFECPICAASFGSEEAVSIHVETCLSATHTSASASGEDGTPNAQDIPGSPGELEARVGAFLSGNPPKGSVEVVLKLLRNIVRGPDNDRFRRVRMSNPKIREAVTEVAGCVELLEHLGFQLREEDGEIWAVMEAPTQEGIVLINKAVSLLEPPPLVEDAPCAPSVLVDEPIETKKVDRQIRVFFSVPESVAAKIHLPDSFYNLSLGELKREADMRKKMIADSQLLIPKSYKEKQAKSARMKYKKTLIRVQFPDGVVLQGVFSPYESTSALYEFVCSALKQPAVEFDLLDPVLVKRRVIPRFPPAGKKKLTLEEEDLVPSALIRFKPIETDSVVFTGLRNELLEISEPLVNDTAVSPL